MQNMKSEPTLIALTLTAVLYQNKKCIDYFEQRLFIVILYTGLSLGGHSGEIVT